MEIRYKDSNLGDPLEGLDTALESTRVVGVGDVAVKISSVSFVTLVEGRVVDETNFYSIK